MTAAPIVIGSWPGPSYFDNSFVGAFCDALTRTGCDVVDVADPRRISRKLDILHVHWPEQIFWGGGSLALQARRTVMVLRALIRLRRAGTRLVWMVHNLRPHGLAGGRRPLWALIARVLPRIVDAFMTLSPATVEPVTQTFPALRKKPHAAATLPAYEVPASTPSRRDARLAQGVDPDVTIYALLGFIRPYKGVEALISAFRADSRPDRLLVIGGKPQSSSYAGELRSLAGGDPRVRFRLERLDPRLLVELTVAADLIVLPFTSYLHSASMVQSLSFGCPVLTPRACFSEHLARVVGEGWVRLYERDLPSPLPEACRPTGQPDLSAMTPDGLARAARALYDELLATSGSGQE